MPCLDCGPNPPTWELQQYKKKIDELTEMLCNLCRSLETCDLPIVPKSVETWWKYHKKADERRKASERMAEEIKNLKEKALSKLSQKEKEALGL